LEWTTVCLVLAVIFFATIIRSAFGFGEGLIAVPLLALIMPIKMATPLATLVSITVAGVIVIQDWHKIHVRGAWNLIFATLFGIPLGLLLLKFAAENVVKIVLGAFIASFSLYCLFGGSKHELKNDRLAWIFGFAAGILGGAYAMNGPPLVVYGSLRRWSPEHFRATLQGYFLPASMVGMCGYWIENLWVPQVTNYYLLSLPLVLLAIYVGRVVNRRMHWQSFIRFVHISLIVLGSILLVQSIWSHLHPKEEVIHEASRPTHEHRVPGLAAGVLLVGESHQRRG
jgi:uncharacterized protein